ncbi:hypothetical protein IAU60_006925 [Kwoniella sp. DSM 27419]
MLKWGNPAPARAPTSAQLYLLAGTRLEALEQAYRELKPFILRYDASQTNGTTAYQCAVGSMSQVRHVPTELVR